MLGLDVGTSVLARFIPRKKDYATRLFRVAFKHVSSFLPVGPCSLKNLPAEIRLRLCEFAERRVPAPEFDRTVPQAPGCASQSARSTYASGVTAPTTRKRPKHFARPSLR